MMLSTFNFRRFVTARPRRRSSVFSQVAEIQLVEPRLLLSGTGGTYDENGYDENGYDINGYDINGYDINGYDIAGYDINGYDLNGYDVSGYDLNGYDISGYDMTGFDINGYDINGYDVTGYDVNGYDITGYDVAGFDINGYDINGYDVNGYDINGYDINGYDVNGLDINGNSNTVTTPPWINSVDVVHAPGQTIVSGTVSSDGGDFTGLSISFDGAFAGYSATVDSTGSFSLTVSTTVYGTASARLLDSTSTEITWYDFTA